LWWRLCRAQFIGGNLLFSAHFEESVISIQLELITSLRMAFPSSRTPRSPMDSHRGIVFSRGGDWGRLSMNLARFGLQARPFRPTPDTQSYYPATPHEFALERLTRAIEDDEGVLLLTGEAGAGKTLLAHKLLERLGSDVNSAFITNCRFASRAEMLRTVLFDLGLPHQGLGEQEMRLALTEHLLGQLAASKRTILVFDEAQDLTPDYLEELRLLGNLETGAGKAVQVLLIGQPSLLETMRRPELVVLNQRLSVRLRLEALDLHESADYLLHQIRAAGGRPERVISDEAVRLIAKNTRGIPRLLNQAGAQALSMADALEAELADVEVVMEALTALGIEAEMDGEPALPAPPRLAKPEEYVEPEPPITSRPLPISGFPSTARFASPADAPEWASSAFGFKQPDPTLGNE
jgi:type II secretory pathway predicted ATPase ExeA